MLAKADIRENVAFIILSGQLDFSTQDAVYAAINSALGSSVVKEIRVDLKDVKFMDSSIIQALLTLHLKASKEQKPLTIINCPEMIRDIFSMAGFDTIFKIV